MGFLLKPHIFTFHSSGTAPRRLLNRLVLLALFIVALQIKDAKAVVDQTEQESDLQASLCETKTLDDVPPDPVSALTWKNPSLEKHFNLPSRSLLQFYDASDVTVTAARKLSEFIGEAGKGNKNTKFAPARIDEFRKFAKNLANEALTEDENLLAFALAAPSVPLAVVQFRDRVNNRNVTDHTFLSIYWRELGIAWNQSDGAHFWGAPFKDCGPMQGRWLWPFSVTVVVQHVK